MSQNATNAKAADATNAKAADATNTTTLQEALALIAKAKEKDAAADRAALNATIAIGNVLVSDAKPYAVLELCQATMNAAKAKNKAAFARFARMEKLVQFGVLCPTLYHERKETSIAYRQAICSDILQHSFFLNGMPKDKDLVRNIRQAWRENWQSFRALLKDKQYNIWQDPIKLEHPSAKRSAEERGKEIASKLASFLKSEGITLAEFVEAYMSEK